MVQHTSTTVEIYQWSQTLADTIVNKPDLQQQKFINGLRHMKIGETVIDLQQQKFINGLRQELLKDSNIYIYNSRNLSMVLDAP